MSCRSRRNRWGRDDGEGLACVVYGNQRVRGVKCRSIIRNRHCTLVITSERGRSRLGDYGGMDDCWRGVGIPYALRRTLSRRYPAARSANLSRGICLRVRLSRDKSFMPCASDTRTGRYYQLRKVAQPWLCRYYRAESVDDDI